MKKNNNNESDLDTILEHYSDDDDDGDYEDEKDSNANNDNDERDTGMVKAISVRRKEVMFDDRVQVGYVDNDGGCADTVSDLGSSVTTETINTVQGLSRIIYKPETDEKLLEGLKKTFESFEDAKKCIFTYAKDSGNQVYIRSSKPNRNCRFGCSVHDKCPFDVRVHKKWKKNAWTIIADNLHHSNFTRKVYENTSIFPKTQTNTNLWPDLWPELVRLLARFHWTQSGNYLILKLINID